MSDTKLVLAFSGGKDSTATALRLAELGEPFRPLFNVTGNELPELLSHVKAVVAMTGTTLEVAAAGFSLANRIRHYAAIPNRFMRWCTRELKIEPTIAWLRERPGLTLAVGLRADEEARAGGWYGDLAEIRYPLREWGWGIGEVTEHLRSRGVSVPRRTDSALYYGQRIGEWWMLWKEHPEMWAKGEELEALTGHTFRSAGRDTWPAAMRDLRAAFEFGRTPKRIVELPLFGTYEEAGKCRVCTMRATQPPTPRATWPPRLRSSGCVAS